MDLPLKITEYGVCAYAHLISGQQMDGRAFAKVIREHYDPQNPRTQTVTNAIEQHLVTIHVRPDGFTSYVTK